MTSGKDKLSVISGVAREMHELHNGKYLACMWGNEDLSLYLFHSHLALQTMVLVRKTRLLEEIWSWLMAITRHMTWLFQYSFQNMKS